MSVVYDAGVLISAERSDSVVWARHEARLLAGVTPITTAPVVAQVSRSDRQVRLRRFLRGCEVVAFGPDDAHGVGRLLAASSSADVVDAHVVLLAGQANALVLTSDPSDLVTLAEQMREPVAIVAI